MQLMSIKTGQLCVLLLKTYIGEKGGLGGEAPQTLTRSYYFEPPCPKNVPAPLVLWQISRVLPYVLLLEDMSSFLRKKLLSSMDSKSCPNVLLCGIMSSETMSIHSSTKNFGKFQCKLRPADVMTFFLVFTCF